jgi:phosphatidate cytidylyltransferase
MTKPNPVTFFVASREAMSLGSFEELKERSLSAVVLAGCALGALFAGPVAFALLVLFVALVMCWEWGHLVRSGGGRDISFFVHAGAVSTAILAALFLSEGWALALLAAGGLILLAINFRAGPGVSVLGVLYVGIPATALIGLRGSEPYGLTAVLFILSVVWAGDIAAFVGGRLIGGPKLYPSISPNKTWAGLISAVLGACLVGALFWSVLASAPFTHLVLCAGALGLAGQLGDLAESALKRLFRVKDASHLIPGHGGFMDRMDGVVTAAILAAAIGLGIDAAYPAKALILGM